MSTRGAEAAVTRLASRQHGVITRSQALAGGMTRRQIHRRLESDRWRRVQSGVYAVNGAPTTWHQRVMSAVLSIDGAVASHRCAAVLHEFDGFSAGRPELTVPTGRSSRSDLARIHRTSAAPATTRVDGIPCTTLAQTLVDVAPLVALRRLERLLDDALASRRVSFDDVVGRLAWARPRKWGSLAALGPLLEVRATDAWVPPQSELERRLARALDGAGMPPWTPQVPAPWEGTEEHPQLVDAFIPTWSIVVEGDGRRWHTRVEDFERDRARDHGALSFGLLVVRFTWEQLGAPQRVRHLLHEVAHSHGRT
ncbi:MAG: type IV toxin-antitoxin system AbiEi family antitoxin domain-containing protein [Acidimicrobiia bacterium]|nr:type IV toxin-antitoxin system AbiEi family antitoxin domain-containing protein [Acidimicrobiia bacterium]